MAESPRRLGIQGRLTIAATALVAVGLVAGALLLVVALSRTLLGSLDDAAAQQARDVATLVDTGNLPRTIPTSGGTVLVQVVDGRGRVVASTPGGDALVPLLHGDRLAAARRGQAQQLPGSRIGISEQLRVVGAPAGGRDDPQTVLVAVSSSDAHRSVRVVGLVLLFGVPALVAGFAVVCWFLVGAALRPVAALRRGADTITETGQGRRLPVPPTRDEVNRLAVTLNDMLDRLAAGGARQRAFVADAAHELRSPLTSMRTQLEVAQVHPAGADWPDIAADMLVEIARLSRLVDDLLLLARLDDDRRSRRRAAPVDLSHLASAAVARAGGRVDVRLDTGDGPVVVDADEDPLVRILDNLLSNAERYAASEIVVAARRSGPHALLTVTDDGPGIPAEQRGRVFERFARLDESRSQASGGSGLGLAIVQQLTQSLGGSVRLEDAQPGLRAVVTLPLAADQPATGTSRLESGTLTVDT